MYLGDEPDIPEIYITWQGWATSLGDLILNGWSVSAQMSYSNWRRKNEVPHYIVRLRHTPSGQMIRFKCELNEWHHGAPGAIEADYFCHEKNKRVKRKPVIEEITETARAEDIPQLLELVLALQNQRPKRKNDPSDNVVLLRKEAEKMVRHKG